MRSDGHILKFALTALHVATLSPINAYGSFKDGLVSLLVSAWVALRGIFDAIRSTIVLITRSISTVILMEFVGVSTLALGVLKAGEAMGTAAKGVVNYFKSPKVPAQPEDIDASTNLDGAACGA